MSLRFRCLILDHDDTAVASAADVHHPAHLEAMKILRPGHPAIRVDEWVLKNFHPGVMEYLTEELHFSAHELAEEYRIWREFCATVSPGFFPGFLGAVKAYMGQGGKVSIVSHSDREMVERHYRNAFAESGVFPDLIFGWEPEAEKRKPSAWPVLETLRIFNLSPDEALIVDDLKPALLMGKASGVRVAGAGWGHSIEEIRFYMKANCDYFLESVEEFERLILSRG